MCINLGSVKKVAAEKDYVRAELPEFVNDSREERIALNVAEMSICHECGDTTAPGHRQATQLHRNPPHPNGCRVYDSVQAGEDRKTEQYAGHRGPADGQSREMH